MSAEACVHKQAPEQEICWCKYPQALYPNWTPRQQRKSRIAKVIEKKNTDTSTIHYLDVMKDGMFVKGAEKEINRRTQDTHWLSIQRGVSTCPCWFFVHDGSVSQQMECSGLRGFKFVLCL